MKDMLKIEELIDILIQVDKEDMESNNDGLTDGSFFSEELRKKIGDAILPTLVRKHKELSKQ